MKKAFFIINYFTAFLKNHGIAAIINHSGFIVKKSLNYLLSAVN